LLLAAKFAATSVSTLAIAASISAARGSVTAGGKHAAVQKNVVNVSIVSC